MRDLTLVLPYFMNTGMFSEQQCVWRLYPRDLKEHFHVIVVDDGSPKHPAMIFAETGVASLRLYRIDVDVRWNWLACRNLGVHEATTEWVLLTDMDHVLPEATLRRLLEDPLEPSFVYRTSRVTALDPPARLEPPPRTTPYKPHPNTWIMTRQMYDNIGGYDERLSGYYGTDGDFRDRVREKAAAIVMLPEVLIRVPREVIPDASTTTYGRKEKRDRRVAQLRQERDAIPNWRPLRLTFPWTRLR